MSAQLDTWYDELLTNVPGATRSALEMVLKQVVADFLRRSGAYAKELPGITLRADRATYIIPKPNEGPILFVYDFFFREKPLGFVFPQKWLQRATSTGEYPTVFRRYIDDPYKVTFAPTPTAALTDRVIPYAALGYDPECNSAVPDFMVTHWYNAILSGAISRLCMQQNKPYTDATLALVHGRKFSAEIANARDQASKQFTRADGIAPFPKWA